MEKEKLLEEYSSLRRKFEELKRKYEELERKYLAIVRGGSGGEKKTAILKIRTTPKLIMKWKAFVVEGGFRSYHEALEYLLNKYFAAGKARVEAVVFGSEK